MSEEKVQAKPIANTGKIAVVLVRGMVGMTQPIIDTLKMLRLNHKNYCAVVENSPQMMGMIKKVKDYVAFGPISEDTFKELVEKRGEIYQGRLQDGKAKYSYKTLELNGKHYKPYFRLNPPLKGFGRKGIKLAFKAGGALGNRGEKMNDLIKRML